MARGYIRKHLMVCPRAGETGCDWANCHHAQPHREGALCWGEHTCGGIVYAIESPIFRCQCHESDIPVPPRVVLVTTPESAADPRCHDILTELARMLEVELP